MNTFDKVKAIVVEQLGVDEAEVTIDSTFIDDLGADSLDIVELIMAFEEEFNVEIPDDVAEKIKTVKDTVDGVGSSFGKSVRRQTETRAKERIEQKTHSEPI